MTQSNSKQRCKVDTIGTVGLELLFEEYNDIPLEAFRILCIHMIADSSGKKETKDRFVSLIEKASSKEKMLTTTTNYILAGQGLGV